MKRIIATSWHPGGANAIIPVIKRLQKEEGVEMTIIGHEVSKGTFSKAGIDYQVIKDHGIEDVSINSMTKLIKKIHPELILTGSSVQDKDTKDVIEQTLTLAATGREIKSLSVLDWYGNLWERFSNLYDEKGNFRTEFYGMSPARGYTEKHGRFKFLPSKIAIMDELAERVMIDEGFDRSRLVITGNPFFDELVTLKEEFKDREKVRMDLGINQKSFMIFYASQPLEFTFGDKLGYDEKTVLRELLRAVQNIPRQEISVLVKVHPREDERNLENVVKEEEFRNLSIVIDKGYETRPALMASDLVVSASSTVLIESSYLGLPSISLQPGLKAEDYLEMTNKSGITIPVYIKGEIKGILERIMFDDNYRTELAIKRSGFKIDGKATERVTNLVYEMLDRSN